jgi:hypothetical protein
MLRAPGRNTFSGRGLLPTLLVAMLIPMLAFGPPAFSQTPPCNVEEGSSLNGAYGTNDGAQMSILPVDAQGQLRITHFNSGNSHRLYPEGASRFQSANDLDSRDPVALRYEFRLGANGVAESLVIESTSAPPVIARRIALVDRPATFKSGDIDLHGRLTLPPSGGRPFKAVIFVHGSDPVASAGLEWLPHLLASNGIATLVFDKRGTGCSKGQYVQHFDVLASDVVAAARWLKAQPGIDPGQIGLAGFSQGGWVAPRLPARSSKS